MHLALIGTGKTGGVIERLAATHGHVIHRFNRKHPPTLEALAQCEAAIIFVPPDAMETIAPLVLRAGIPAICGTTAYDYQPLHTRLVEKNTAWIYGSNFSYGVNIFFALARYCEKALDSLHADTGYSIHEVHQADKKDAPSGTALYLKQSLSHHPAITYERPEVAVPSHSFTATCEDEVISLTHHTVNRSTYAKGALWAATSLLSTCPPGLHRFESLFASHLQETMHDRLMD